MTAELSQLTDGVVTLRPDSEGTFAVEVRGRIVGSVRLRDIGENTGEIAYALDSAYRGQGYATRAVRLLVEYAFGDLGLGRVQARVPEKDPPALRVARRAGLRNEGVVRVPRRPATHTCCSGGCTTTPRPPNTAGSGRCSIRSCPASASSPRP